MKNIESETAAALWPLVIKGQNCSFLEDWVAFVNDGDEKGTRKAIKKDEWDMFLEFNKNCKGKLSNFEDDGSFPSIFDDFLEWKESH